MAEAEVRPSVIKKTQESLGRFIKRPPLTEKLLRKPPFRFLHDIVTAVIRQYGLMDGLFTAEEMISDNVKDKERKIAFLQKVIDTMKLVTGAQLNVRPSKVVAGQEAERTNELLQAIGKALERKLSSKKAVEQVLGGLVGASEPATEPAASKTEKPSKSKSKTKDPAKEKHKEEAVVNGKPSRHSKKPGTTKPTSKERKVKEEKPEPEVFAAPVTQPTAPEITPDSSLPPQSLPDSADLLENGGTVQREVPVPPAEPLPAVVDSRLPELGAEEPSISVLGAADDTPQTSVPEERPPSVTPSRVPTAIARPPSVRPGSARPRPLTARPAAPRLKERLVRPAREEPASPVPASEAPSNLIPDTSSQTKGVEEEDDSTFVVEEATPVVVQETSSVPAIDSLPEHAGHLVTQILGAQRELEPQREASTEEDTSGWHAGETWRHSELLRLRESVQGLVRAANPLGRLLDFLQEDVEAMQLELENWQSENQELRAHIAREARATAESTAPLQRELAGLEVQVEQQRVALATLKTAVLTNEKRLTEMLLQ